MDFFCYLNPQSRGASDDRRALLDVIDHALEADRSGFKAFLLTHHHFDDYNTYANPFLFGSYLAPRVEGRIIITVVVAGLMNPVELAEQINLLDQLSDGRAIVAFGAGGDPRHALGLGRETSDLRELGGEVVNQVKRLWTLRAEDEEMAWETSLERGVVRNRIMPAPYTVPHPPLGRGTLSDDGVRQAGTEGVCLYTGRADPQEQARKWSLYWEAFDEAGHPQAVRDHCREWSAIQKLVYVAETDEQARADTEEQFEFVERRAAVAGHHERVPGNVDKDGNVTNFRVHSSDKGSIVGSPETVVAKLREYEEGGTPNLAAYFCWGLLDRDLVSRSMQLFVDEVMPHFSRAGGRLHAR